MTKIKMTTPIVEMDGDEMTRILWKMIKDHLLEPYIELNTEYYDLGLEHRSCSKVRDDYAECRPHDRVSVKGNVEESQRNDPGDSRRHGVPGANRSERH